MIHTAYNKSEIAKRYYLAMGRNYDNQAAIKQWSQDRKLNLKVLKEVFETIYTEQKQSLKTH